MHTVAKTFNKKIRELIDTTETSEFYYDRKYMMPLSASEFKDKIMVPPSMVGCGGKKVRKSEIEFKTKKSIRLTDKDTIEVVFADGERTATASITLTRLKELIMDEAREIITTPKCGSSSCAVNGFCECDPVNEDMEYAGIYLCIGV